MQRVRIFDAQRNEITDDALNSTAQPMLDGEIAEVVQLMQPGVQARYYSAEILEPNSMTI